MPSIALQYLRREPARREGACRSYKKILNYANIFEYFHLPSAFFDVRVHVHACMMTGAMQISLGLTRFQFALALLLPSSHTRLGLKLEEP